MDSIKLQKQIRDNADDLQAYLKDLISWEEEMKRKEILTKYEPSNDTIPEARNRKKKKNEESKPSDKAANSEQKSKKKISAIDYAAWDKFDADAELEKLDKKEEPKEPTLEELMKLKDESAYEKEKGNKLVKVGKWKEAAECYTNAIKCYKFDQTYYCNRALCYLKLAKYSDAEADCSEALRLDNTYVKAYLRRALARIELERLDSARRDLEQLLHLEPGNKVALEKLDEIKNAEKKPVSKAAEKSPKASTSVEPARASTSKAEPEISEMTSGGAGDGVDLMPWTIQGKYEVVYPIYKPPNTRSREPLKRIEVVDVPSSKLRVIEPETEEVPFSSATQETDTKTSQEKIGPPKQESHSSVDIKANLDTKSIDSKGVVLKTEEVKPATTNNLEDTQGNPVKKIFVEPKSSVQFYFDWKQLSGNDKLKFEYLKGVKPERIPSIFGESMESPLFSDVVRILSEYFVPAHLPVYDYLNALSKLRRLSALVMFMTRNDKAGFMKLLQYCEENGQAVDDLKRKFEL